MNHVPPLTLSIHRSRRRGARRVSSALALAALMAGLLSTGTTAQSASAAGAPSPTTTTASTTVATPHIVFILPGQSVGVLPYGMMEASLDAGGFDARVLDLAGLDVRADAAVIAGEVDRARSAHPGAEISLVGHSAGGMSAREYLKHLGGTNNVSTYVAIGSPQYGSPSACIQGGSAQDLCPGSPFLTQLNAGDDTPGQTGYYSIRGAHEWADGRLDGGQCRMPPIEPPTPLLNGGFHHSVEPLQPEVIGAVTAALHGVCTGSFVDEKEGSIQAEDTIFQDGI